MSNHVLTFDPDTHTYRVDGEPVPSVTQLTAILGSPLPEEGDDLERTVEAAAERGTVLHAYLQHRIAGGYSEDFELPDVYGPYAEAVELFLAEHDLTPGRVEQPLSGDFGGQPYAGTPDFVGEFDGETAVADWKFISTMDKTKIGAQINGYRDLCLCNDIYPQRLVCVQFLKGTYRLYNVAANSSDFGLCVSVYRARNKKHPKGAIV